MNNEWSILESVFILNEQLIQQLQGTVHTNTLLVYLQWQPDSHFSLLSIVSSIVNTIKAPQIVSHYLCDCLCKQAGWTIS